MNGRTMARAKKSPAPVKTSVQLSFSTTPHPKIDTSMSVGHDFGRISVHAPSMASYPTTKLSAPRVDSFGEACDIRPAYTIQPLRTINQSEDKYEQEADRIAKNIMQAPESHMQIPAGRDGNENNKSNNIQTSQSLRQTSQPAIGSLPSTDTLINGCGQPLPEQVRMFLEPHFGHDFSQVRVHTDGSAAAMAMNLHARAFTLGNQIVFGSGQYTPDSNTGRQLLAHELTHVVQQRHLAFGDRHIQAQNAPPLNVPKRKPTIEYHIITQDEELKVTGGVVHKNLKEFRKAIMKARPSDTDDWTLFFEMHGWEKVLAYNTTCEYDSSENPCITKEMLDSFFGDETWRTWRDLYGPTKVVLLACYLEDDMAKATEEILLRKGSLKTAAGKNRDEGYECETRIIAMSIKINSQKVTSSKQYKKLSESDRETFMEELHDKYQPQGYGSVDTSKMDDESLLHYYFNESPKGKWLVCEVWIPRDNAWVSYYDFEAGKLAAAKCYKSNLGEKEF